MALSQSLKVAVIGAGVSGLLAARELRREGHQVVVLEKANRFGGTWLYDSRVEADLLGLDANREIVHSSLYKSLRTNLPRPIMGFSDYPFTMSENGDSRNFPGHEEVLKFLERFVKDFGLHELIRFNSDVVRVERVDSGNIDEWVVESRTSGVSLEEVFEAVVVGNGHYTEPRVAKFPGFEKWPGKQVHSHNYRHPEAFCDQVVVIIGSGPSAYDMSREIATVAKEVHLSSRSPDVKASKLDNHDNIWQHLKIDYVTEDGMVAFQDGFIVHADSILHCTGYKHHFPFLKTNGIVSIEDNRVGPLYKHVFPPQLAPRLSFIGLPQRTIIFLMLELQSKWIAQVLSGKVLLPSQEQMLADIQEYYKHMEECGIPKHHTHTLNPTEFRYLDWLAAQIGMPPPEEELKGIYKKVVECLFSNKDNFRDE
ncbi:unnamed protein product [Ilex paraguariensis]|uniref:Flavin-containing monooxygenase n=1 Tax=Ilex paraguariensis TaxID=185542 RepID=A0ABC8SR55_9AQUA